MLLTSSAEMSHPKQFHVPSETQYFLNNPFHTTRLIFMCIISYLMLGSNFLRRAEL